MADFPTSPLPNYPVDETQPAPQVLITMHRDGSEQRRLKGSGTLRKFKLQFGKDCPLTNDERVILATHYAGESGNLNPFTWTHPERGEAILVRYAGPPVFKLNGYNSYEGEVMFQEVPA